MEHECGHINVLTILPGKIRGIMWSHEVGTVTVDNLGRYMDLVYCPDCARVLWVRGESMFYVGRFIVEEEIKQAKKWYRL